VIKVLLADDQHLVREGFARLLRDVDGIDVVGQAANGEEAVRVATRTRPHVVLMDVRMPVMDGVEATARITTASPEVRVLLLTTFDLDEEVHRALQAGASAFLLKDTPTEQLVHAIRVVAEGESVLAPSATRRLIEAFGTGAHSSPEDARRLERLTDREREVLLLMAEGLSNAEIGTRVYLSESTVKTHVGRVLTKLGCRDRVQAVVLAYRSGFARPT
jgi:DNA-binding NarL/FixJ family response regulator